MAIKSKGKGKSGGARVITFNVLTNVEMVRLFPFFSMIKRVLQPSKSMLSSNLCETWNLILNKSIIKLLELFRFQQFLIVYKSNKQETLIPIYIG